MIWRNVCSTHRDVPYSLTDYDEGNYMALLPINLSCWKVLSSMPCTYTGGHPDYKQWVSRTETHSYDSLASNVLTVKGNAS